MFQLLCEITPTKGSVWHFFLLISFQELQWSQFYPMWFYSLRFSKWSPALTRNTNSKWIAQKIEWLLSDVELWQHVFHLAGIFSLNEEAPYNWNNLIRNIIKFLIVYCCHLFVLHLPLCLDFGVSIFGFSSSFYFHCNSDPNMHKDV